MVSPLRRIARRVAGRPTQKLADGPKPQRFPAPWQKVILWLDADLVLDVGASVGRYGLGLRKIGYGGRIVSFEPLTSARAELERHTRSDPLWSVVPVALGEADAKTTLHVSGNSGSSSLLDMLDRHSSAAPSSAYVGAETVEVRRLDEMLDEVMASATRPFLKLDVQGYELAALRGAGDRLVTFRGIQLELSEVPLYEGAALRPEVMEFLETAGFALVGVLQGFSDPGTGQMLQMDGLFVRRDLLP